MAKHQCWMCSFASELERGESTDLRRMVQIFLSGVTTQLGVHAADVLVYDAAMQALQYAGGRGFNTRTFEHSNLRTTLAGQVVRDRQLVRCADLRKMKNEWARSRELIDEGFVTYVGVPLIARERMHGVLEIFHREHLNPNAEWLETLGDLIEHGAIALANALLATQLLRSNRELSDVYDATIDSWAAALELRDYEPKGHTQRVTDMTVEFARIMKVPEADLVHVRRGAMLHDVGKMGIPDSILLKADTLTEDEWKVMRQHPTIAYEQLASVEYLHPALVIPYCHHEKWDGTGYPRGLAGEQIPFVARLFALVDVRDVLGSDRPYRKGWPEDKVREHIRDRSGKNFDPKLAEIFVKLLDSGNAFGKKSGGAARQPGSYLETSFNI